MRTRTRRKKSGLRGVPVPHRPTGPDPSDEREAPASSLPSARPGDVSPAGPGAAGGNPEIPVAVLQWPSGGQEVRRHAADLRGLQGPQPQDGRRRVPVAAGGGTGDSTTGVQVLHRGYHQLRGDPETRALTAFNGNGVQYEYRVLSSGPKNGPAFARFVFFILGDLLEQGKPIVVFFDDIIVGGKTLEEHLALFEEVLKLLQDAGATLKSTKVRVAMQELPCLGFIVSREGVKPDPENVAAILRFPRPTNQTQLRGFLGLLNFYGSLVPHLQEIVHPLNRALSKDEDVRLKWTLPMTTAFDQARDLFRKQVLTHLPDLSKPCIVTTDASESGLGGCLSQRTDDGSELPIAFFSKGIDPKELDPEAAVIKTRELELYAFLLYAFLLPAKAAEGVHRSYMQYFRRYGVPDLVRSDNGTEFNTLGAASTELGFEWSRQRARQAAEWHDHQQGRQAADPGLRPGGRG